MKYVFTLLILFLAFVPETSHGQLFKLEGGIGTSHYFWHENDLLTLTSRGYILSYGVDVVNSSVMMLPEINDDTIKSCYGICSNNIIEYIKYK